MFQAFSSCWTVCLQYIITVRARGRVGWTETVSPVGDSPSGVHLAAFSLSGKHSKKVWDPPSKWVHLSAFLAQLNETQKSMCRLGAHKVIGFCCFNMQVPFAPKGGKLFCIKMGLGEVSMRFSIVFTSRWKQTFSRNTCHRVSGVVLHLFVWYNLANLVLGARRAGAGRLTPFFSVTWSL